MLFNLPRSYKDKDPKRTIKEIREILFNLDITLYEKFWANPYENIWSVRIESNQELGKFGTNGKGQTIEYCLASAYGEFIERLQNNLFLIKISHILFQQLKIKYGYYCYPDEKYLSKNQFKLLPQEIREDLLAIDDGSTHMENGYFKIVQDRNPIGCVSLPFLCSKTGEITFIPYNLLIAAVGSNGMAAGNSKEEALTQALFELMERWTTSVIFYRKLSPPTIPNDYIKNNEREYGIINQLKNDGFNVIVKDFSAGLRLPVLGVILIYPFTQQYTISVGSDSSFQVALSRCLTELYQGIISRKVVHERMNKIEKTDPSFFLNDNPFMLDLRDKEFSNFITRGCARFPISIFNDNYDYDFIETTFDIKANFKQEIQYWTNHIHELGYNLYIRDTSFLGYPSYHLYIPKITSVFKTRPHPCDFDFVIDFDRAIEIMCNIDRASVKELKCVANLLDKLPPNLQFYKIFSILLKKGSNLENLRVSFIAALIWFRLKYTKKSKAALNMFMKSLCKKSELEKAVCFLLKEDPNTIEYKKLRKDVKSRHFTDSCIRNIISFIDTAIWQNELFSFPSCPNCDKCNWRNDCLTKGRMALADRVYPIMDKSNLNYSYIKMVLNNEIG